MLRAADGRPCELGGATAKFDESSNYYHFYSSSYLEWVVSGLVDLGCEICDLDSVRFSGVLQE